MTDFREYVIDELCWSFQLDPSFPGRNDPDGCNDYVEWLRAMDDSDLCDTIRRIHEIKMSY